MFERFTTQARRVVVLAQGEAARLRHNYIGTEHILLGLLGEPNGVAYRALARVGMSLDGARQEVQDLVGAGQAEPSGHIPFTPRAKKTLELSLREALQLQHNYIGTEHLLLGLISEGERAAEGEGAAVKVLKQHVGLAAIRAAVIELVPAESARAGPGRPWLRHRAAGEVPEAGSPEEQAVLSATPAADA